MSKPTRQKMCTVHPQIVALMAPLVGSQSEIMVRMGISWNSWNKLLDGQPIRCSMAERLRTRILNMAENLDSFIAAFPAADGGLDRAALEQGFMTPLCAEEPEAVERELDLVD